MCEENFNISDKVLKYDIEEIVKVAKTLIKVNPYMSHKSITELSEMIVDVIKRAHYGNNVYVSTAGFTAIFDEWEEEVFVEFYIKDEMVYDAIFPNSI